MSLCKTRRIFPLPLPKYVWERNPVKFNVLNFRSFFFFLVLLILQVLSKLYQNSWVWCHTYVIPALGWLKQEKQLHKSRPPWAIQSLQCHSQLHRDILSLQLPEKDFVIIITWRVPHLHWNVSVNIHKDMLPRCLLDLSTAVLSPNRSQGNSFSVDVDTSIHAIHRGNSNIPTFVVKRQFSRHIRRSQKYFIWQRPGG